MSKKDKKQKAKTKNDRPEGWHKRSHSDDADPSYEDVFPAGAVKAFTIRLAPEAWQAMQDDLDANLATRKDNPTYKPIWMPATIESGDNVWTHVGVRPKGAFSLSKTWKEGALNLPFKLDFDQFEDDYPATRNQRFYGYSELMLGNNTMDPTGMRETLLYNILAEAGLPSLSTSAYELFLDHGGGPVSLGLYTAVEVLSDTGVARIFGNDKGNLYEADGDGASLATDVFDKIPMSFSNKTNDKPDHADLKQLYELLHDDRRTTDPPAWRADLESVFNVDSFLAWLGIARFATFVDTYGFGAHNFYLYNDPATQKLNWISWDHNQSFEPNLIEAMSFDCARVSASWPLIRFLLDDPVYYGRYVALLEENSRGVLEPGALTAQVRQRADLLAPYAAKHMPRDEYDAAVGHLTSFIEARAAGLRVFLDQNKRD